MKRIGVFIVIFAAALFGMKAAPVFAESLVSATEQAYTVSKDQTVDGTAYLAGNNVNMDGTVKGDVYCAGRDIVLTGTVEGDVLCGGQNITISGVVHGDVRAAGMNVTLKGTVDGSVTISGLNVVMDSAAKVGRDATLGGARIDVSGSIGRDVMVAANSVNLDGIVGRDVQGGMTSLSMASTAKVGGNVSYESKAEANIPAGVVTGKITRTTPPTEGYFGKSRMSFGSLLTVAFLGVLSFVVLSMLVALVLPRYVRRVSVMPGWKRFGTFFLVGLVSFVVLPVVLLFLSVSIIGMFSAFVLAIAYLLALLIGATLVAYRLGQFMLPGQKNVLIAAAIGAVVLGILGIVPFIGWIIILVATITGLGMIILGIKDQYRSEPVVAVETRAKKTKRSS